MWASKETTLLLMRTCIADFSLYLLYREDDFWKSWQFFLVHTSISTKNGTRVELILQRILRQKMDCKISKRLQTIKQRWGIIIEWCLLCCFFIWTMCLKELFIFVLKELAIKFFPDNKEVCYYIISSFVFLRYFAPAILNPRLFELTDLNIVR